MHQTLIKNYLREQGLKLNVDEVTLFFVAASSAMQHGQLELSREKWLDKPSLSALNLLFRETMAKALGLPATLEALQQIYIALDTFHARNPTVYASIYLMYNKHLARLFHFGTAKSVQIATTALDENSSALYQAARCAYTGWLQMNDERAPNAMSLPILAADEGVNGVLYVEAGEHDGHCDDSYDDSQVQHQADEHSLLTQALGTTLALHSALNTLQVALT